jgi:hypothetical protein
MKATQMLFFTKNKRELVPAGDPRGKFQAFTEGQEIPDDLAERSGLKQVPAPQRKVVESAPNKSATTERI